VPALTSDRARSGFRASLTRLLRRLKANSDPTIVVKTCFWADPVKDAILSQVCKDVGGVLVDGSAHGKVEANLARSERAFSNGAVGGHPGDRGMQAIADSILEALRKVGQ
jgi:alpha-galactosidase